MRTLLLVLAAALAANAALAISNPESPPAQPADSPTEVIAPANADLAWRPSAEQRAIIARLTRTYFAARDAGNADDAYTFLSSRQKQYVPFETFKTMLDEFNAKAGPVQARRLRKITWYRDTPQGRGLYVAVDYSSEFTNLALHCGYLVWQVQTDGTFLLTREEANVIDRATMEKLKPEVVQQIHVQFRC
jgi:hypothetical protein